MIDDTNCDQRIVAWLRENHQFARRIGSVCTGAFFLACAGLLAGRPATTHWEDCDILQDHFPDISVEPNKIFVRDGRIWTSAGITAGIDMALAMVEEDYGREPALAIARNLVVFLKRPGGQSQFSTELENQVMEGPLTPLLKWIVENPGADLRTETLADKANMSVRTLYRAFEEATGVPPAEWVEVVRLGIAKRLLEQTDDRVDQIARKAGFVAYERMRRCFARRLGVTPAAYRERFAQPSPRVGSAIDVAVLHEAFGLVGERQPALH
jgi:transcriptional regulator GlxA family with amidase domain